MAHQLSCNDEHLNGTINQYYGCCFLRPRWRDRIRSVRYRRNLLFGDLYAWFWIQHWVASNGSSKEWRARLQGNRQDFFSRLIFPFGIGYLSLPSHSYGFPIYIKEADRFLGYLSNGNPILGLAQLWIVVFIPIFSDTFFFSGDNAYKSSILGCCHSGINQYSFKFLFDIPFKTSSENSLL